MQEYQLNNTVSLMFEAEFHCGVKIGSEGEEESKIKEIKKIVVYLPENAKQPSPDNLIKFVTIFVVQDHDILPESLKLIKTEAGKIPAEIICDLSTDNNMQVKWESLGGKLPT